MMKKYSPSPFLFQIKVFPLRTQSVSLAPVRWLDGFFRVPVGAPQKFP